MKNGLKVRKNSKYKLEAYDFVLKGLEFTMKRLDKPRHVSGQELSLGLRDYAFQEFGPLAQNVLVHWGIKTTSDFGELVYILIDAGLMRKTEEDSIHDFDNVFDFDEVFGKGYSIALDDDEK